MGQDDVKGEALGGVSFIDNWSWDLVRRLPKRGARGSAFRRATRNPARLANAARSARLVAAAVFGAATVALLLSVATRTSSVNAPPVRAALEMTMTLFALAGAWLLRAQFAHSRRLRDLLLLGGFLVLGLMNFWTAALPAALNLRTAAFFSAAEFWSELAVGAIFAAAALVHSRHLIPSSRHSVAVTAVLGMVALMAAFVGAVLLGGQGRKRRATRRGSPVRSRIRNCSCSPSRLPDRSPARRPASSGAIGSRRTAARRRWRWRWRCSPS